jgi:hypothetical protein
MLGVTAHLSEVQEIKTEIAKIGEDSLTGWITLEMKGSDLTLFFRHISHVEDMIESLQELWQKFVLGVLEEKEEKR